MGILPQKERKSEMKRFCVLAVLAAVFMILMLKYIADSRDYAKAREKSQELNEKIMESNRARRDKKLDDLGLRRDCPKCKERIKWGARICPYCQSEV